LKKIYVFNDTAVRIITLSLLQGDFFSPPIHRDFKGI